MCLQNPVCATSALAVIPVCASSKASDTAQAIPVTFSVISANGAGPFSTYDPTALNNKEEELLHTYAEFSATPREALALAARTGSWALCIEIPRPRGAENPTLRRLEYMVAYATTHDADGAVLQTDTLLTAHALPEAPVVTGPGAHTLAVYKDVRW